MKFFNILKSIIIFSLFCLTLFIIFLGYSGLFHKMKITEERSKVYTLVYKKVYGDYGQVGEVANSVSTFMEQNFIKINFRFGLFFDDPQKIEGTNLRSIAGVILDEQEFSRIDEITGKSDYLVKEFSAQSCLKTIFPLKNQVSIMLGVFKTYPTLKNYINKNSKYKLNPVMEIYDIANEKIVYLMSILPKEDTISDFFGE